MRNKKIKVIVILLLIVVVIWIAMIVLLYNGAEALLKDTSLADSTRIELSGNYEINALNGTDIILNTVEEDDENKQIDETILEGNLKEYYDSLGIVLVKDSDCKIFCIDKKCGKIIMEGNDETFIKKELLKKYKIKKIKWKKIDFGY